MAFDICFVHQQPFIGLCDLIAALVQIHFTRFLLFSPILIHPGRNSMGFKFYVKLFSAYVTFEWTLPKARRRDKASEHGC